MKSLCISLIEVKSPSRSEHLNGKTATLSTFFHEFTQRGVLIPARNFRLCLQTKVIKKVPKVAVLWSVCSDLGRDSVYSYEMHSGPMGPTVMALLQSFIEI